MDLIVETDTLCSYSSNIELYERLSSQYNGKLRPVVAKRQKRDRLSVRFSDEEKNSTCNVQYNLV